MVSPGMKSGILLFNCMFSILSSLFMTLTSIKLKISTLKSFLRQPASFFLSQDGLFQQIGAHFQSREKRRPSPPFADLAVMTTDQYLRHMPLAKFRRPCVLRIIEQVIGERILRG